MLLSPWFSFGRSLGAVALSTVVGRKTTYRSYTILTKLERGGAVATVYSGEDAVYRAHDDNEVEALLRAQQWIDERQAYATETDLHAEQTAAA